MSWAFPNRRLVPALAVGFAYLVLCTAQRGMLLGLVHGETGATRADGLRVMVLGTQADLAVALALCLPFVLWALVLPERAWRWKAHRATLQVAIGTAMVAMLALVAIESFYFVVHRARLGRGAGQRMDAMWEFLSTTRGGAPLVITGLAALATSVIAVALVATFTRRSLDAPRSALGARVRDSVLVMLALAFFVGLAITREPEFPGRRTLRELSGNGVIPVARVAWSRVPASWKRWIPPRLMSHD